MTPRVAMLAMIMAGLSTMSPYTNHSSKATETSPKVERKCLHGACTHTSRICGTQAMMPSPPATSPVSPPTMSMLAAPLVDLHQARCSCLFGGTFMRSVTERPP